MAISQNFTVEALIGTSVYNLSDSIPFELRMLENIGPSPATRITMRGPDQDGDSDVDYQLEPRTVLLGLQARTTNTWGYEAIRALASRLFKATNTPLRLRLTLPSGSQRQIDCYSVGDVSMPLSIEDLNIQKFGVKLRAANPTWYDPNGVTANFGIAAGSNGFTVPTFVPTFFGGSVIDQTTTITYQGTYRDFPIITVYGPITNLAIRNLTTGDKILFTGYTINNGDYYTIDLRYGRKLVYRNGNLSDNRISETTNDSNLATFALEADPDVPGGQNVIQVTGTSATGVTRLYLQYFNRYDGI